jgi:osmotically-inducible protein OsmY
MGSKGRVRQGAAAPAEFTDRELQASVQALLRQNGQLPPGISVAAHAGTVSLQGLVESSWQRAIAEQVAAGAKLVRRVENNLRVVIRPGAQDRQIGRMILAALSRSTSVNAADVAVAVTDGLVTLSGTLPHWQALRSVLQATRHVPGVRDILNDLKVAP